MPFSKLGLTPVLCTPLARMGYTEPTPVQSASIPLVLSGADLLARAQTGTGKTAAFALPMIDRLLVRRRRNLTRKPLGLVLVPTRELAVQVHRALATYGAPVGLRATVIFGGVPMPGQVKALRQGADIVVATPGRLHRPLAAPDDRSVGGRNSHARRSRSNARHGVSAAPSPRAAGHAAGAPDADVLRDAVGSRRAPRRRIHARAAAGRCVAADPWRQRSRIAFIPSISIASGRCSCTS